MATNRFVCEICNKGFQRDQNLQLHRRGHNLPWKLRQRSSKEVRKRVYVCPEPSCVHNDPSRALGDLTGIKKHYCRKHGEKKWKCDKCSKKYAVQSDWKAHLKTCGTREYRCDCGTLFSRRDSFITHRAFCDALAEESAKAHTVPNSNSEDDCKRQIVACSPPPSSSTVVSAVLPIQNPDLPGNSSGIITKIPPSTCLNGSIGSSSSCSSSSISSNSNGSTTTSVFPSLFASSTGAGTLQPQTSTFSDLICAMARSERSTALATVSAVEPTSLCLSSSGGGSTIFGTVVGTERRHYAASPAMSATALLQKAAQMGAASTSSSFLRGLGLTSSSSSGHQDGLQWSSGRLDSEPGSSTMTAGGGGAGGGLGLRLPCDGSTALTELMMGPSSMFGPKPTTLDLLGLGIGVGSGGGAPTGGFSALITSMGGGGLDVAAAAATFGGGGSAAGKTWGPEATERKPSPALL
ncbi:zinc finger protein GAI-ASSOCIATED FACTOR 1-like isoform X2 [Telopea speciosissima]|nr:zinc finger protein GAI-ASSOCIATED FACTOR 1-like isoform X2 [Telopea speciosissima]